jgi:hypothetical protein
MGGKGARISAATSPYVESTNDVRFIPPTISISDAANAYKDHYA